MFSPAAWVRIWPFLAYIAFIAVGDLLARVGATTDQLRLLYPVKIAVVVVLLVVFWRQYDELHGDLPSLPQVALALVSGGLVFWLWVTLSSSWMVVGQPTGYDPTRSDWLDVPLMATRVFGAALVVPIMEELFWRSYLMRMVANDDFQTVQPQSLKLGSFVVTVILFGIEHTQWLAGMVAGVIYGLLYMRTGSLWVAITSHAVTNGVLGGWIIHTKNWTYW